MSSKVNFNMISTVLNDYNEQIELKEYEELDSGKARTVIEAKTNSGKSLVIYFNTNRDLEDRFRKEEKLVEKVNRKTDIPTQHIIHSNFKKDKIPHEFYIAQKVQGYDPINRFKYLPVRQRNAIVRQSAEYLAELHSNVKFESYGDIILEEQELVIQSQDWYDYMREWVDPWIQKMGRNRFSDLQSDAKSFIKEYKELAQVDKPRCVHFDVTPDNLIVHKGNINAIIDWEKAISAPPEWDLAYSKIQLINVHFETESISNKLEKIFLQNYIQNNELEPEWRKRILYFETIWTFKTLGKFEEWIEEENKQDEEDFFRDLIERRFQNLEKEAKNMIN
jgi:aminoglycoside phosphotransferase (APT) family kinase protein